MFFLCLIVSFSLSHTHTECKCLRVSLFFPYLSLYLSHTLSQCVSSFYGNYCRVGLMYVNQQVKKNSVKQLVVWSRDWKEEKGLAISDSLFHFCSKYFIMLLQSKFQLRLKIIFLFRPRSHLFIMH